MDVSIIIVNWNTKELLRDCLDSVYRQTSDIHFETIVIDNASTDSSIEMVKRDFPQVVLIENSQNKGFAAGNNQGMAIARGRYVLLLNSDTVILDGAIQKTLSFADRKPVAAVIGCRVLNPDRTLQLTCFMFPGLLNLILSSTYLYKVFPKSRFFGRERMSWWDRSEVREVEVVTGCFMLVRREAMEQVGLMDEGYFMYAEETDWCYRFHRAGWKNLFFPGAEIIHLGGGSSRLRRHEMTLNLLQSVLLFYKKHKGLFQYTLACCLLIAFFLLRIPYWLVRALLLSEDRRFSFQKARTYGIGAYTAFLMIFRRRVNYNQVS